MPGRDGFLFLTGDANDVIGQHTGRVRMGARRRRGWRDVLARRVELMAELGLPWRCLVAPDKETVYADKLPPEVVPAERTPVHDFMDAAREAGAPVVFPADELREARERGLVYGQSDTHWTQLGAYVAYRRLCDEVRDAGVELPVVDESRIEWVEALDVGDLGEKGKPQQVGGTVGARLDEHRSVLVEDNLIANHGRRIVFEAAADAPSCVAFGESFANQMLLFLKESFGRLIFVHTSMVDADLLAAERPDVVLSIPLERFLLRVPRDEGAGRELERIVARKRAAGRARPPGADRFLDGIPRAE
jgi:acetyltransferase AlgX (SGNH hydrolase-like protein)